MDDRTDDRIDELIALAALGELSETEEAELDALLADDVELANEVDGAMEAAAELHAALPEGPPAGLKASVLDAIAATPQASAGKSWVDEPPAASARVIDLAERRRSRWIPVLSAAAAVVLLFGVGFVISRDDSVSVDDQIAAEAEIVVAADDVVARVLEGELGGTLTVFYSPDEAALVIDGDGMEVLGEDRAFVLWFVDGDTATPVQTFRPDSSGEVLVRLDDVDPTDVVLAITEEDAGGAETPTLPILASA